MAVIRNQKERTREGKGEAHERARQIVEEAKRAGEALLEQTRQEIAENIEKVRQEGILEGGQQAQHLRHEIDGLKERMVKEIEGEVVRSSLRVAQEVLELELQTRDDAVVDLVRAALATARNARDVFIRVNPKDAPVLREHKKRLIDALGQARDVDIREDKKVAQGGVLIQTESGVTDAQLRTQLEEITTLWGA